MISLKQRLSKYEGKEIVNEDAIKINKDSSNFSMPPSTDNFYTKKNHTRKKSDRNIGGQKNHKGHNLSVKNVNKILNSNNNVEYKEINHFLSKSHNAKIIERYVIDIKFITVIEKHIYYVDKESDIPAKHNNPVNYGCNLKTFVTLLFN